MSLLHFQEELENGGLVVQNVVALVFSTSHSGIFWIFSGPFPPFPSLKRVCHLITQVFFVLLICDHP